MMKKKEKEILRKFKKVFKNKRNFIPLHEPTISKIDVKSVTDCLKSTFVSSTGKSVLNLTTDLIISKKVECKWH